MPRTHTYQSTRFLDPSILPSFFSALYQLSKSSETITRFSVIYGEYSNVQTTHQRPDLCVRGSSASPVIITFCFCFKFLLRLVLGTCRFDLSLDTQHRYRAGLAIIRERPIALYLIQLARALDTVTSNEQDSPRPASELLPAARNYLAAGITHRLTVLFTDAESPAQSGSWGHIASD